MKRRLTRRDFELLKRIAEHGHLTVDVLRFWYPELSKTAASTWVKRLRKSGHLESASLDQRRRYYRLSHLSVMLLRRKAGVRVSRAKARPLKPLRKAEQHAFLLFTASASDLPRQVLRPCHDTVRFGDLAELVASGKTDPLRQKLFYCEGETVGYFVLDRGSRSFVTRKVKPKVFAVLKWASFQQLLAAGHFRLTIVTTAASRAEELTTEMKQEAPPFPFEITVLEEIAALLPTRSTLPCAADLKKEN